MIRDPVCGMMVDQKHAVAISKYKGESYFFCSKNCKEEFDANPGKYTEGGKEIAAETASEHANNQPIVREKSGRNKNRKLVLPIKGMTCASCVSHVEHALKNTDGITFATVNLATEQATVEFLPKEVDLKELVKTVHDTGYEIATATMTLPIGGMTCASCANHVTQALKNIEGVIDVNVNLATERAQVEYIAGEVSLNDMEKAVADAGYQVLKIPESEATEEVDEAEIKMQTARFRMKVAWVLTVPIIIWMFGEMFFGVVWPNETIYNLGMVVLSLPVLFWVGRKTFTSGWSAIVHGYANMDSLIMLGTGVSLLTGPASFFLPVTNYAGVAAMIMAFHLTGRYIEETAKGRASQAIRKLLDLGAKTARILRDGKEVEIPIEEVIVGDIMVIRPGEKIPTDGVVVEGEGAVDESMATGESMPVTHKPGDEVIGATINQEGLLKIKATKIGKDTFLSQVIKMVEECQGSKVPIQEFADKVTGFFVPAVIAIALLTVALWLIFPGFMQSLVNFGSFLPWVNPDLGIITLAIVSMVAVLVIACPCALGLATPTALMVGSGIAANHGILFRSGEAIQTLKDVNVVVFDKTGTITKGKPEVTNIISLGKNDVKSVLFYASSAEQGSEHPLAGAIVKKAKQEGIELKKPEHFQAVRGKGIIAKIDDRQVLVGTRKLLSDYKVDYSSVEEELRQLEEEAKTAMIVSVDSEVLGIIAVADQVKDDSAPAIAELRRMGIETTMITGDNQHTAEAIARMVGIDHVMAGVLPERKLQEIINLQSRFGKVAFVGDGINDAPALTQANVGIAIGTGTDIAIEASDVTLVRGELTGVVEAILLSRETFRKIRQNLFWAFFYNVAMIPLAMIGWMHPVLAEIAMASSSITVVSNANLLKRVKILPDVLNGKPKAVKNI